MTNDLVERLRKRAEIRRQIPSRKSVREGKPDRIADLLDEAASAIEALRRSVQHATYPECKCEQPMVKCDHTGVRCIMCGNFPRRPSNISPELDKAIEGFIANKPPSLIK